MQTLNFLPQDHPLRNKPLIEIKARYRNVESKVFRDVVPAMKIAKLSYNELANVWTTWDIWEGEE